MPDRLHRHDTLVLAKALSTAGGGRLAVIDVQQRAIDATRERLADADADGWPELRVEYHLSDHSDWLEEIDEVRGPLKGRELKLGSMRDEAFSCVRRARAQGSASLVVFNLGYLPGGDKTIVTTAEGTERALLAAERAVGAGGCVSVTLYPGHEEGRLEEERVLAHASQLPQGMWSVYHCNWLNQRSKRTGIRAPSLVLLQRMNA